jgi:phosphoenolpyruvate-protein phosphotransferase/dihydroxyacetone kinase phosphotransfer subunit
VVGIVVVSHSYDIAQGAAALARQMAGDDVRIEIAGGLDEPEHPIGTDAMLVMAAIERAWSDDGVLVLMDLGSAVLSAEMALDFLDEEKRAKVLLTDAPIVEGAVAAAVTARIGASLDQVAAEAAGGLAGKSAHLGAEIAHAGGASPAGGAGGSTAAAASAGDGTARTIQLAVDLPHGLHARPAARFVQTVSGFDADVTVRNVTTGTARVHARSLNAVATLGVTSGHVIEVTAAGPQADDALDAVTALAQRRWDEIAEDLADGGDGATAPASAGGLSPSDGALSGVAASPGYAVGEARRSRVPDIVVPDDLEAGSPDDERAALDSALAAIREDIARQRDDARARLGAGRAAIFDAHLLFLQDEALLGPVARAIDTGAPAPRAWRDTMDALTRTWEALDDAYLRERAGDLRSVGRQVLARLLGADDPRPQLDAAGILVAVDLEPADTVGLDPAICLGIATARGGPTSHAAVLARALAIPAVVGLGDAIATIPDGTPLALDGVAGVVHVRPDAALAAELRAARDERTATLREARTRAHGPAVTLDGETIEVAANIGTPVEVPAAVEAGADGVGLFRTEFLFMGRDAMPDEDEQEAAYRAAADALDGRPLLVRTLDAGADKPLPYLGQDPEANPFLGVRGLRLGLTRPELLDAQLRALLRVAAERPVRVMFPMVATLAELLAARSALDRARTATGVDAPIEVGVMIEVPSAALTAAHMAAEVDFFSVGTNDLTQYTLAADRGNDHVAALTDPLHPAVLRLIAMAADAARAREAWVGVCGELAGDASACALLLGLGVRELSMSAPAIATVKDAVRATRLDDAERLAAEALAAPDAEAVRALLERSG